MSTSQSRKKILFITRPLSPPWDEASKNFAFDLAKNVTDHDITILVDKKISNTPEHITQKKIYTQNHFSLSQKLRLVNYLRKNSDDFDVIHLLFTPTKINSFVIKMLLKNKKVKVVQTIATVRDDLYSTKDLKHMFFGDVLVMYSQWGQKKLRNLGFTNVYHIYPGIDLSKYIPEEKNSALMEKWKISSKKKIVTYSGEYVRLGATDMIVDAFIDLWQDKKNYDILYLCNCRVKNDLDASKKKEVQKKFALAGHANKVVFTDTVYDMNAIYNLSDIIIFPVENMRGKFDVPLAMIEPYACKKPVIASDLPLFKEFSSPEINAIIPKANSDALKNMICELVNNPEKCTNLGENAFAFAHKTFNITQTAKQYGQIYKEL
ncbi:MAG: hypothetical protein CR972_03360 [Candidatus Moraniibacteriota bacterium]|nr:MAG: hypothetical protein CR972_03360 [Candidatus Moranbacteria bacterium]